MKSIVNIIRSKTRELRPQSGTVGSAVELREKQDPLESNALSIDGHNPRYNACHVLADAGVPCCIWGEDALAVYGIPTLTWDLFLLVRDTAQAAEKLAEAGYVRRYPNPRFKAIPQFSERYGPPVRSDNATTVSRSADAYESEDPRFTEIVLLPAKEWYYELPSTPQAMESWIPPLPKLLDSLMTKWTGLTEENEGLRWHVACHINYCYQYIGDVKQLAYSNNLSKDNWQLHFDQVAGTSCPDLGFVKCQKHYQSVRDTIRSGQLDPTGPSGIGVFPPRALKRSAMPQPR